MRALEIIYDLILKSANLITILFSYELSLSAKNS